MSVVLPPSIGTLIFGTKCTVRRNGPDGSTTHLAWTTKTVGEGEAFFHRKSDIESGDTITFSLSSGGKAERTVDVVSVSLDGQSKRVIWRIPGGVPSALALNDLHPEVQRAAGSLYRSGHFAEAIGAATKALEVAVRHRTGLPSKNLMGSAFGAQGFLDVRQHGGETGDAEQEGFRFLFMGAARALRNPRAHEFIDDDSVSAMEHLALVSLLLRRLDNATVGKATDRERAHNQAP